MNNQEAKFILSAYRPDGRDGGDPMFAEALAHAERDPELRAWFERQRKFDTTLSRRLQDVTPPAELRAAILAGGRVSRPRRKWWTQPGWLAAAAAMVLLAAVAARWNRAPGDVTASRFAEFAMKDLAEAHGAHVGHPPEFAGLQATLSTANLPLAKPGAMAIEVEDLRRKRCRSATIGGREVFEICFQRDGAWFHLYVAERRGFAPSPSDAPASIVATGDYAAATWADARNVYALVTQAGREVLKRVI